MSFSPVRLNHAVLFVADLERAERFYTEVFGMVVAAREPRANAAFLRLPRSGNHHDLGLFGVGTATPPKRRGRIGLYHLAWQVDTDRRARRGPQALVERRCLHRRVQPRRDQERLRRRPRRQRVRDHVDAAPRGVGRVRERRPGRAARPRRRGRPLVRRPHRRPHRRRHRRRHRNCRSNRAGNLVTVFADPTVVWHIADDPARAAGRTAARPRCGRGRHHRARRPPPRRAVVRRGPRADRRGRRLRLVRQPGHRPPGRGVADCRRWTGSAAGWTASRLPGGRSSWSGSAAARRSPAGSLLSDPSRFAGAAILYGTLPFDAGVPMTPARLAGVPVFVAQGEHDTVIPPRAARPHLALPAR